MDLGEGWKLWANGMAFGLEKGAASIPYALLAYYRKLKLTDTEAMLLIQLLAFRQIEQSDFPSMEEIERRMGGTPSVVASGIRKLMKDGWLSIDEVTDSAGIRSERYNLTGMYHKLSVCLAEEAAAERQKDRFMMDEEPASTSAEDEQRNLFFVFEKEFARPLSPMECETISGWLDQDGYVDELIRLALKEAVFAGKVHFRYIDRILLEWGRNGVKTAQDAKEYMKRFRGNNK
ncbi:DnaD domain-containing protein [Paenibacillus sp. YPG26]|uniref:DnaD domain-containing protein n=1 Tax=Paenibacillus sp. YPG26 TaxID=2878915 RepID=UPI00203D06E2|nr:DnaD domain-containing protein [Paenibacillus sp. YPG26]USB34811.1 DnaD domain-containing protein [Paenibacillus sp. YPG26]